MKDSETDHPHRELYALLHISPKASDEEIRRAYRQWAQVYHPDKYQALQMKDIATENFQRIREAYEILTDENKRQIYDIYGMEGLTSGLELGPKLNRAEEIKEKFEKLRRRKEEEKVSARVQPSGLIVASLSLPQFLSGAGIMRGMAMASDVQSQISKRNTVAVGGNLTVTGNNGGGSATAGLRHQVSSLTSIEFMATAGLRSLIGTHITRHLSLHSTATSGITISLADGSINLSNAWTRQLSETASGNIQLALGTDSAISVGWKKKDHKTSAAGELKFKTLSFGTLSFEASGHYKHHFSSKSHGRIEGKIGSTTLELDIGGGRKISDYSVIRLLYSIGLQGIFWKIEYHRGEQKLIIPILLSRQLNPVLAAGALVVPSSLYFVLKVQEARASAKKSQQLLENVSNRKRNKQLEVGGLIITKAEYGNTKVFKRRNNESRREADGDELLASQVLDVTIPLNFLVTDSGQLKLHEGVKKSGIMGFCDPCPGEPKQLHVEYTCGGNTYEVYVADSDELFIPQEVHRV
ncbi:hypothetical protein GIB67_013185 [Kingdonia uniflora]|uniref:J domain-containing protein n=1 Tax=Kingdonia uniflora TaxID=39325 RepID=A0A7J7LCL7_9MAGN|nr:hypothetical protein GIB67_013185 [Kingdonia uniflora]